MKRLLLITALAALGFASCTEIDTDVPSNRMKFNSVISKNGNYKVAEMVSDNLSTFKISAYNTSSTDLKDNDNDMTRLTINEATFNKSVEGWTSSEEYYWSANPNDKFQFFAYSSPNSKATYNASKLGSLPTIDYEVADEAATQEDFLVALVKNRTSQDFDRTTINLSFKHALTQVNFSIKPDDATLFYKIKNLKIKNVKNKGQYEYSTTIGKWTPKDDEVADYVYVNSDKKISGSVAVSLGNGTGQTTEENSNISPALTGEEALMLLPQKLKNVVISVEYEVYKNSDFTSDKIWEGIKEIELNDGNKVVAWEQGKKVRYILNLPVGAKEMKFTADVEGWDTTEEQQPITPAPSTYTLTNSTAKDGINLTRIIDEINGIEAINTTGGLEVNKYVIRISGTISEEITLNLQPAGVDNFDTGDKIIFDFSTVTNGSNKDVTITAPTATQSGWNIESKTDWLNRKTITWEKQ